MSLLVVFLFLEIILRIFGPEYYKFNDRSQEYYTNPRNYHFPIKQEGKSIVYGLPYVTSKEGYRIPDGSMHVNGGNENAILGLGDSFTFGRGVKYEDIYLSLLQRLLDQHGYKLNIKNCGIAGANLPEIFETYLSESFPKTPPLVIYGFVLNDFGLPMRPFGEDFIDRKNGGYHFSYARKISSLYNLICHLIEKRRLHNITLNAYREAFRGPNAKKNFEILKKLDGEIKARNGKLIIVLFPLFYDFDHYPFHEMHGKISSFCKKEGIALLDLFPVFSRYNAEDLWANPTDQHPNEIAHRIAAQEIYDFLVQNKLLLRLRMN